MGIESDQLVYDYLSRVGDLAHRQQLPSADRMRLVAGLRNEIDRQRARYEPETAATVRRILQRIGTPEEVLAEVSGGSGAGRGADDDPPARPRRSAGTGSGAVAGASGPADGRGPGASGASGGEGSGREGGVGRGTVLPGVPVPGVPEQRGPGRARGLGRWSGDGADGRDGSGGSGARDGSDGAESAGGKGGKGGRGERAAGRPRLFRRARGKGGAPEEPVPAAPSPTAALPPHLAGADELGSERGEPDWWRVDPVPFGAGSDVPGFAGGIEIPELLRKPRRPADEDEREDEHDDGEDAYEEGAGGTGGRPGGRAALEPPGEPVGRARTVVRALRERRRLLKGTGAPEPAADAAPAGGAARPRPHALLLLAAAVLVAGLVSGLWLLLPAGWALVYVSRVPGPAERKAVLFGLPGAAVAGMAGWVWGRADGRWGEALASGQEARAFVDLWPWGARAAAVGLVLYLVWRSRRP
ncbi:hypothetical protein [Streptomyces sp. NPDC097619]|uniref:hypothetical protein n=1 Tax=Streptomyces sp. NPDC097619 TaxID=3157228 RepID=UPI0033307805